MLVGNAFNSGRTFAMEDRTLADDPAAKPPWTPPPVAPATLSDHVQFTNVALDATWW